MPALLGAMPAFATVVVSSPANGSVVNSNAQFNATATTATCQSGVAAMGVYMDNRLVYTTGGASLNAQVPVPSGKHNAYVQEWDNCGGTTGTGLVLGSDSQSSVAVASPSNNSTVAGAVNFVASATTSCSRGVAAMGVYINDQLAAVAPGATLNRTVTLPAGTSKAVVQSWDGCGASAKQQMTLKVAGQQSGTNTIKNIQAAPNWDQWGELPPVYDICAPCDGVTWGMAQHQKDISLSGDSTRFDIGGSRPYADVLWSNKLIGQGSTLNMPDRNQAILPGVHNLTYDADVFITNWGVTQDFEFDINMYMDGLGMEWGTECNHLADGVWDIWDNVNAHWIPTGVPCKMNNNAWNHVSLKVQRLADNSLLYQTITVNGVTSVINKTYPPFQVPSGWYGMTANFQMDGNRSMSANTAYLDNLNVSYW